MGAAVKIPFISELGNSEQMSTEFFVLLLFIFDDRTHTWKK